MAKIEWSPQARQDLEDTFWFHQRNSENYAIYLTETIVEQIDKLENFPRLGRVVPEMNL